MVLPFWVIEKVFAASDDLCKRKIAIFTKGKLMIVDKQLTHNSSNWTLPKCPIENVEITILHHSNYITKPSVATRLGKKGFPQIESLWFFHRTHITQHIRLLQHKLKKSNHRIYVRHRKCHKVPFTSNNGSNAKHVSTDKVWVHLLDSLVCATKA